MKRRSWKRFPGGSGFSTTAQWTGPPEIKFMTEPVPAHADFIHGIATRDVTVDADSGLRVRIYLPDAEKSNNNEKLPILLHFHGGGFCISRADWYMYYHAYARLAQSLPAVCVSVFLPLAPESRLPAACADGFNALLLLGSVSRHQAREPWLEEHGNFDRVFLIGDSSGGNIVHDVATRASHAPAIRVVGAVPIHPGFVRPERSGSEVEELESPFLTLEMVDKFLGLALPEGSTKEHQITCPMGAAAPPLREVGLPPFLLCVAERDLIRDTETEYYKAMMEAGKEVELLISCGIGHSFYLNKIALDGDPRTEPETDRLFAGITDFIAKH